MLHQIRLLIGVGQSFFFIRGASNMESYNHNWQKCLGNKVRSRSIFWRSCLYEKL